MKLSMLYLIGLFSIVLSCSSRQSSDEKSSASTSVAKDTSVDSLSMAQEAAQNSGEPEDGDVKDSDPSENTDRRRDGVEANVSQYKFLGFSEDLTYAAFSIGWRAGSGPDITARLSIVNIEKNDFVGKPITAAISDANVQEAVNDVMEKGSSQLSSYRISGKNVGTSYYVDDESNVNIPFDNKIYKLKLIQKSAPDANKFFELQVLTDGEPIILQSESSVPRSRGYVVAYRVISLFVLEDKVAVFIEYDSPDIRDHENDSYYNVRQLLVTGSLVAKQD